MKNPFRITGIFFSLGFAIALQGCTMVQTSYKSYDRDYFPYGGRGESEPRGETTIEAAGENKPEISTVNIANFQSDGAMKYQKLVSRKARRYQIDYYLMLAIVQAESAGNTKAISTANCRGLTQLHIRTARQYDSSLTLNDLHNPETNLEIASRHMAYLRKQIRQHFPNATLLDRVKLLAASWNAGLGRVKRSGGIPNIVETQQFTRRVLSLYRKYRWGA